jgi:iron complex outermembrane receptor protein
MVTIARNPKRESLPAVLPAEIALQIKIMLTRIDVMREPIQRAALPIHPESSYESASRIRSIPRVIVSAMIISAAALPATAQENSGKTEFALEEVFVTAQKRSENLKDVPLSVSSVSGDDIREQNLINFNEVGLKTPNTRITVGGGGGGTAKMRGLGSGDNPAFEQAVGLLVDGVYYGRISYLNSGLADLDRIEILRGPQGTLMGKNTIAGAINMTTKDPSQEWELDLGYGIGTRNRRYTTVIANAPIIEDALSMRLVVKRERQDGRIENTFVNEDQFNIHKNLYRVKFGLSAIDNLNVVATYEENDSQMNLRGLEIYKATDQTKTQYGQYDPNFETEANYKNQTDGDITAFIDTKLATLKMEYKLGEYILSSVSGWTEQLLNDGLDGDAGPIPFITTRQVNDYQQYSQEFRITSPVGVTDYIAGLYLFGSDFSNLADTGLAQEQGPAILLSGQYPNGAPLIAFPGIGVLPEDHSISDFNQEVASAALFGQFRWRLLDEDLTLMAGLRYSYEKKEAIMTREFTDSGIFFTQFQNQEEFATPKTKRIEKEYSPKVSATYRLTSNVNAYATFAKAFKGGGFNAAADRAEQFEYDEEQADTHELGLKGDFLDGLLRINAATFHTEFSGLQVSVFDGTTYIVQNAADAITKGVEIDATLLAARGLIATLSVGYTDATYTSFPGGPCPVGQTSPCDLSGGDLDRAPMWNGNLGFNYKLPFENLGFDVVLGGDANYQGRQFTSADLDPVTLQDGVVKYNARIAIQAPDLNWQVQLVGKNLSDEMTMAVSVDVPVQPGSHMGVFEEPKQWALDVRYRY